MINNSEIDYYRSCLDYSYHDDYTHERKCIQNTIINDILSNNIPNHNSTAPWILITAGPLGAGKTFVRNYLEDNRIIFGNKVTVDMDEIRDMLPESTYMKYNDPLEYGLLTQKESGYIAELCILIALSYNSNLIIDGSMINTDWQYKHYSAIKKKHPHYKMLLLHISASPEIVKKRIEDRRLITGRAVPDSVIDRSLKLMDPCKLFVFRDIVDHFIGIDNSEDSPRLLHPWHMSWDDIRSLFCSSEECSSGSCCSDTTTLPTEDSIIVVKPNNNNSYRASTAATTDAATTITDTDAAKYSGIRATASTTTDNRAISPKLSASEPIFHSKIVIRHVHNTDYDCCNSNYYKNERIVSPRSVVSIDNSNGTIVSACNDVSNMLSERSIETVTMVAGFLHDIENDISDGVDYQQLPTSHHTEQYKVNQCLNAMNISKALNTSTKISNKYRVDTSICKVCALDGISCRLNYSLNTPQLDR